MGICVDLSVKLTHSETDLNPRAMALIHSIFILYWCLVTLGVAVFYRVGRILQHILMHRTFCSSKSS